MAVMYYYVLNYHREYFSIEYVKLTPKLKPSCCCYYYYYYYYYYY